MKRLILSVALISFCVPAQWAIGQSALVPPTNGVLAPIDETQLVTLKGNVHPLALRRYDGGAAPASIATGRIRLLFKRSDAQQEALSQYLDDLQTPASPNYHKWLTPTQYGATYGISDSNLSRIRSWLESHGFRIERVPKSRSFIEFSGTLEQIGSAFHTAIHTYTVNGQTYFANVSDPQIPMALEPLIAGVGPLNNFHPKPSVVRGPGGRFDPASGRIVPELTLSSKSAYYLFVDPADAAVIYDTPNSLLNSAHSGASYDGTGISIGIIGGSDLTLADVENYRTAFLGETPGAVNLPTVIVDGNDPGLTNAGTEALLDTEVAGGIAPKSKIYFYTSADTDLSSGLLNAISRALDDNAVSILSLSFSDCETDLGTSGNHIMLEAEEQAAAQGITFVVSAGDNGPAGCDNFDTESQATQGFAVSGFASTPYSIAVGGTDFDVLSTSFASYVNNTTTGSPPYYPTALKYIPEAPLNDSTSINNTYSNNVPYRNSSHVGNIFAGSGGASAVYAKPAFQVSLTPNDGFRDLPDVSLLAGNGLYGAVWVICSDNVTDGVSSQTYTNCQTSGGQFTSSTSFDGIGGTSASAPAFAGMLALVAQAHGSASDNYRLGQANDVLYQLAQSNYSTVFHDVVAGNNSVACTSGSPGCGSNLFMTGYNATTGYDLASGLGSVDVAAMVSNWTSVSLSSTTTNLKINGSTAAYTGVHGQSITFDVSVSPTTASGVAGIVDNADETNGGIQNNGQLPILISSGTGSTSFSGLPGGSYTVWARYGGDTSNASSTSSPPVNVTISPEPSTTTLVVNAYNPQTGAAVPTTNAPYGSDVLADATITGTAEGSTTQGVATGTIQFLSGGTVLGSSAVSTGNLASWPPLNNPSAAIPAGNYTLTAKYSGDASYSASTSGPVSLTIVQGHTSLAAPTAPSYNPLVGTPITFTTNLSTTIEGVAPTGTVTFMNGSAPLGSAPLSGTAATGSTPASGTASFTTSALPAGTDLITAVYSGDTNYSSATSSTYSVTLRQTLLSALQIVPSPSTITQNQPLNITINAVPPAGAPVVTGTVTLTYGTPTNQVNVSASLANGSATFTIPANTFSPGPENFLVAYSGDSNYIPGTNSLLSYEVNPSGTMTPTITVTGPSSSVSSYPFTVNVTISGPSGKPTPTGTVSIDSSLWGGYEQLNNGSASQVFPQQEPSGNDTITATYYGDANYTRGSGSAIVIIQAFSAIAFNPTSLSIPVNQALNVTISVTATGIGIPVATGNMTLSSGSYTSSPISLSNGSASFTIPANALSVGAQTLTATYSGDTYHKPGSNTTTVTVTGGQPASFSMNATSAGSISAGGSGSSTLTITPAGGFTGAVNLSCHVTTTISNYNDLPTCVVPASVTISGTSAVTATLNVSTTPATAAGLERNWRRMLAGGSITLGLVFLLGIPARRRRWRSLLGILALIVISVAIGCGGGGGGGSSSGGGGSGGGGGGNPGTTAGTYSITVTGTDAATGMLTAQTVASLTVN